MKPPPVANYFTCPCSPEVKLSATELRAHIQDTHGIAAEGVKFKKTLVMHINRRGGHGYIYDWTITPELTVRQTIG